MVLDNQVQSYCRNNNYNGQIDAFVHVPKRNEIQSLWFNWSREIKKKNCIKSKWKLGLNLTISRRFERKKNALFLRRLICEWFISKNPHENRHRKKNHIQTINGIRKLSLSIHKQRHDKKKKENHLQLNKNEWARSIPSKVPIPYACMLFGIHVFRVKMKTKKCELLIVLSINHHASEKNCPKSWFEYDFASERLLKRLCHIQNCWLNLSVHSRFICSEPLMMRTISLFKSNKKLAPFGNSWLRFLCPSCALKCWDHLEYGQCEIFWYANAIRTNEKSWYSQRQILVRPSFVSSARAAIQPIETF